MGNKQIITEDIIQESLKVLNDLISNPPPPATRRYSRRQAFEILRGKAKEALAAGHSLEAILDDLRGVGLGLTLSSARQYLKPGKGPRKRRNTVSAISSESQSRKPTAILDSKVSQPASSSKGTFTVVEDEKEI